MDRSANTTDSAYQITSNVSALERPSYKQCSTPIQVNKNTFSSTFWSNSITNESYEDKTRPVGKNVMPKTARGVGAEMLIPGNILMPVQKWSLPLMKSNNKMVPEEIEISVSNSAMTNKSIGQKLPTLRYDNFVGNKSVFTLDQIKAESSVSIGVLYGPTQSCEKEVITTCEENTLNGKLAVKEGTCKGVEEPRHPFTINDSFDTGKKGGNVLNFLLSSFKRRHEEVNSSLFTSEDVAKTAWRAAEPMTTKNMETIPFKQGDYQNFATFNNGTGDNASTTAFVSTQSCLNSQEDVDEGMARFNKDVFYTNETDIDDEPPIGTLANTCTSNNKSACDLLCVGFRSIAKNGEEEIQDEGSISIAKNPKTKDHVRCNADKQDKNESLRNEDDFRSVEGDTLDNITNEFIESELTENKSSPEKTKRKLTVLNESALNSDYVNELLNSISGSDVTGVSYVVVRLSSSSTESKRNKVETSSVVSKSFNCLRKTDVDIPSKVSEVFTFSSAINGTESWITRHHLSETRANNVLLLELMFNVMAYIEDRLSACNIQKEKSEIHNVLVLLLVLPRSEWTEKFEKDTDFIDIMSGVYNTHACVDLKCLIQLIISLNRDLEFCKSDIEKLEVYKKRFAQFHQVKKIMKQRLVASSTPFICHHVRDMVVHNDLFTALCREVIQHRSLFNVNDLVDLVDRINEHLRTTYQGEMMRSDALQIFIEICETLNIKEHIR